MEEESDNSWNSVHYPRISLFPPLISFFRGIGNIWEADRLLHIHSAQYIGNENDNTVRKSWPISPQSEQQVLLRNFLACLDCRAPYNNLPVSLDCCCFVGHQLQGHGWREGKVEGKNYTWFSSSSSSSSSSFSFFFPPWRDLCLIPYSLLLLISVLPSRTPFAKRLSVRHLLLLLLSYIESERPDPWPGGAVS